MTRRNSSRDIQGLDDLSSLSRIVVDKRAEQRASAKKAGATATMKSNSSETLSRKNSSMWQQMMHKRAHTHENQPDHPIF